MHIYLASTRECLPNQKHPHLQLHTETESKLILLSLIRIASPNKKSKLNRSYHRSLDIVGPRLLKELIILVNQL